MNSCLNLRRILASESARCPNKSVLWNGNTWGTGVFSLCCFWDKNIIEIVSAETQTCSETRWMGSRWKRMLSRHIPTQLGWASRSVWTLSGFHWPSIIKKTPFPIYLPWAFLSPPPAAQMTHCQPSTSLLGLNHEKCFHFFVLSLRRFEGRKDKFDLGNASRADIV